MDLPSIAFEKFRLDNGLTVIVHEDRKAPLVAVSVWYRVGSADEPPGRSGFAHLFEHLMFSGSEHHRDGYFAPFERVGATDVNGTTSFDRTNYFQTVPASALDLALWMESDRMGHLLGAIGQHELDTQRGVVQNEKRQHENRPYGRVWEALLEHAFPQNHPYRHTTIGSMDDLKAASLDDVRQWFGEYYGAANVTIALAGDISPALAREKMQAYFGDVAAGPALRHPAPWIAPRTASTRSVQIDAVPQRRLLRQWNVPGLAHADAPLLELAAFVLGGSVASRLYRRLVHRERLVDEVSVGLSAYALAGLFVASANLREGVETAQVEAAISEEWERFLAEGPDEDELLRAKTVLRLGFVRAIEKIGGRGGKAAVLAEGEIYHGDPAAYRVDLERCASATPATVLAAARRWLARGDHTLLVTPEREASVADAPPLPPASAPDPVPAMDAAYATRASGIDRRLGAPQVQHFPQVVFPEVRRARLRNGIEVVLAERAAIALTQVRLQLDAGIAADRGRGAGTAKLAFSMLGEGTRQRDSLAIALQRQRLGAQWRAETGLDASHVGVDALNSGLSGALELLAEIVREPAFRQADLERLRAQCLARIRRERADPAALGFRVLPRLLYGADHAYGIPFSGLGSEAAIASISPDALAAFHRDFVRPDRAAIFVVGDTNMETVLPLLDAAFGDWAAPDSPAPMVSRGEVPPQGPPRLFLVDRPGAQQSQIFAARTTSPTMAPDHLSTQLANAVFGGAFTSRLNMNLREDKHWSYGAHSTLVEALGPRPLLISAPVQTDRTAEAIGEILGELRAIGGDRPPTDAEIAKVKAQRTRALPGSYETGGAVLSALANNRLYGRGDDYVASLARAVEAQTTEQVAAAAKHLFATGAYTWLVVGDLSKVEAPVRALGFGELHILDPDVAA
ncbi:M16 family metallopeptidase [Dokdonella ginsengisoli]|uniref:M16 family metallopeptidase n=1 Tax=Dokdonella ginsengisoli TaxID=363846 RepID=A0ABV9R125_9GAMM